MPPCSPSWNILGSFLGPQINSFCCYFWGRFLDYFLLFFGLLLGPSGEPCFRPDWTKRSQDGIKRPPRTSKYQKPAFAKTLEPLYFLFLGYKAVQDSLGKPKKAPKRHLNDSKTTKRTDPKISYTFRTLLTDVGNILGTILGAKIGSKMGPQGVVACSS